MDLLKRKNPRFTAFLGSNAYIKLALGTGAGPAMYVAGILVASVSVTFLLCALGQTVA